MAEENWRRRAEGPKKGEKVLSEAEILSNTYDEIRGWIRKAADIKDPREMWFCLRDILNTLAMWLVPEPDVILPEHVPGHATP